MRPIDAESLALLRLTLTPGLGPILIGRMLAMTRGDGHLDDAARAALELSESALKRIKGIGAGKAPSIVRGLRDSGDAAEAELRLAERLGVEIVAIHSTEYPPLLRQIDDAPPILYVRGRLDPNGGDRYPVAIVGSRSCSAYGIEQAERFAGMLAERGLCIVSGGARGIDTAAHRAALRMNGRSIAVLGCGLAHCYPPDNAALFDTLAGSPRANEVRDGGDGGAGAVISELPLSTQPSAENFPARNRIISGISLGVLVVEAGRRSGALITARVAVEEQGREVFALPGRIDSPSIEGSLDLIKSGGAAMVTHPDDILAALESAARHHHAGTHDARFTPLRQPDDSNDEEANGPSSIEDPAEALFAAQSGARKGRTTKAGPAMLLAGPRDAALTDVQKMILAALDEPRTLDQLSAVTSLAPGSLRAEVTVLELHRRVARRGSLLEKR